MVTELRRHLAEVHHDADMTAWHANCSTCVRFDERLAAALAEAVWTPRGTGPKPLAGPIKTGAWKMRNGEEAWIYLIETDYAIGTRPHGLDKKDDVWDPSTGKRKERSRFAQYSQWDLIEPMPETS